VIGASVLGFVFTTPADQPDLTDGGLRYQLAFNFDTGPAKVLATTATFTESAMQFMTPPNPTQLTSLKARGKMIVFHGTADGSFSANATIGWYDALAAADPSAADYARLFLVPGMGHCGGGPACLLHWRTGLSRAPLLTRCKQR